MVAARDGTLREPEMNLKQLQYFVQIVESGSVAKASRQLYIAQPALSQQLKKLEDTIGKPLLVRSPKGVAPTENGLALYHHAKFILRQLDQALSIAQQDAIETHGMVTVGLPSTTLAALGLRLVQRIRERYPRVLLNVVEGMSGHLTQMIRLGQLDIAILFKPNVAPDLRVTPILEEELFVLLPPHSMLLPPDRSTITLDEAARLPLIMPTGTHGLRQRVESEFEVRSLIPNIVAEIDSLSLLMSCVRTGMGATIKPMSALLLIEDQRTEWRALKISDAHITRRNYLYTISQEMLSPAAALVALEIRSTIQQLAHSGEWPSITLLE